MAEPIDAMRKQLIAVARRRSARIVTTYPPCKWQCRSVTDPRTGRPFTAPAAWEFVIELLEAGVPLYEVELEIPAGKIAYAFTHNLPDSRVLYVKLQLLSGEIAGRSFHYSVVAGVSK